MLEIFTQFANFISYELLNLDSQSELGQAVHFFIEDISKILVLVLLMIYIIAWIRSAFNMEKVRAYLQGKSRFFGYIAGSSFGAITPFCSCSSIPLFLGFTSARIPIGVTLSFLITSPLLNEIALVLLGSMLGWEFTLIYLAAGLSVGILGGFLFDWIGSEKYLQDMAQRVAQNAPNVESIPQIKIKMTLKERHLFAKKEALSIFKKIWKWVLIGVGAGASIHGFVPQSWIIENLSSSTILSVPVAALLGIPLYSNASGMIPIIETLIQKGLPVGTALTFMLSVVGASFPEFLMLKEVLKPRLLAYLFLYFLLAFSAIGIFINLIF